MFWNLQSSGCSGKDWIQEFAERMHSPSVSVDHDSYEDFSIIKVIRVKAKDDQENLLKIVEILTDINLVINKAYITSDAQWYMDVFHVTSSDGSKLRDEDTIHDLDQALESMKSGRSPVEKETTCIELVGADRRGLLSEISAVLKDVGCNVVQADIWTHRDTAAAIVNVTDAISGAAIEDQSRILTIQHLLVDVLRLGGDRIIPRVAVSDGSRHSERRLHQMMAAEAPEMTNEVGNVALVTECPEKNYSVVSLRSLDRPKLLFDALCAIIDMDFVVFHATVLTIGADSCQEYFIRHKSGLRIVGLEERWRVESAILAALQRRGRGVEIELLAKDREGLLSDVTKVLRENGMNVRRAEILTRREEAEQRLLVWDFPGKEVDEEKVEEIEKAVKEVGGVEAVRVKGRKVVTRRRVVPPIMLLNVLRIHPVQRLTSIGLALLGYPG